LPQDETNLADFGHADSLLQQVQFVGTVICRVANDNMVWFFALLFNHLPDNARKEMGHQRFRSVGCAPKQQRGGIAETPLELPGGAHWFGKRTSHSGIPDKHFTIGAQDDNRWNGGSPIAKRNYFGAVSLSYSCGRKRRTEVNSKCVPHGRCPSLPDICMIGLQCMALRAGTPRLCSRKIFVPTCYRHYSRAIDFSPVGWFIDSGYPCVTVAWEIAWHAR
jgi:hypothetical protein